MTPGVALLLARPPFIQGRRPFDLTSSRAGLSGAVRFPPARRSVRSGGRGQARAGAPQGLRLLVSTLATAGRAQQVANPSAIQAARGYDPVIDDHPAVAAALGNAGQHPAADQARQSFAVCAAGRTVEFGGIEIRKPHLDPGRGICTRSETEAVAVSDVANHTGEARARAVGQPVVRGCRIRPARSPADAGRHRHLGRLGGCFPADPRQPHRGPEGHGPER